MTLSLFFLLFLIEKINKNTLVYIMRYKNIELEIKLKITNDNTYEYTVHLYIFPIKSCLDNLDR